MPQKPIEKLPDQSVSEMAPEEVTKAAIRQTVWKYLESNNLVKFPRPVYRRIPNFEGAAAAAEKASTLEEFKNAKVVKINPDKPQENARYLTLEAEKTLLVPTPRLKEGLFNQINPPPGCGKDVLRICSTAQGVREHSSPIGLEDKIKVDLIIVGSVAVSKTGLRIGKGEGFADMEYAMMRCMEAVNENTIVVTTVHNCQIVDIPESLIEAHDLTVDYIVTDTDIIKCDRTKTKPEGIIWSKITPEKMQQVPILKVMREKDKAAGKDTTLKDGREESDIPEKDENEEQDRDNRGQYRYDRRRRPFQYRRRYRGNQNSRSDERGENEAGGDHQEEDGGKTESGNEENQDKPKGRPRRQFFRRRRFRRRRNENSQGDKGSDDHHGEGEESEEGSRQRQDSNENQENRPPRRRRRFRQQPRQRRNDSGENDAEGTSEDQENERPRRNPRNNRRRRPQNQSERSQSEGNDSGNENQDRQQRRRPFRPRKSMPTIFFGSLPRSLRVSELKTKVRENNINPLRVIWNGGQGHAFFQFQNASEMETALESLKDFEIKGRKLRIEVANRSRQRGDNSDKEGNSSDRPDEGSVTQSQAANNEEQSAS